MCLQYFDAFLFCVDVESSPPSRNVIVYQILMVHLLVFFNIYLFIPSGIHFKVHCEGKL